MARAIEIVAKGDWSGNAADTLVLTLAERSQQNARFMSVAGQDVMIALPTPVTLRSGDALKLEDGRLFDVLGAPEPLQEVRAEPDALIALAWACGNRHIPVEIRSGRLRLRRDPASEALVLAIGATSRGIEAPFEPAGLAYAKAKGSHAEHKHGADHGHHHHHGADCGCGHDHGHDDHKHGHAHDHHGHHHGHKHD